VRNMSSTRKALAVMTALKKKGFEEEEGKHHFFYYHYLDGTISPIKTMISHSAKDIDKSIIGKMSRQCNLSKDDFLRLVDCPLTREDYECKLKEVS